MSDRGDGGEIGEEGGRKERGRERGGEGRGVGGEIDR